MFFKTLQEQLICCSPSRLWTRCRLGVSASCRLNWEYLLCCTCLRASKFPIRMSQSHWAFTHGIRHSLAFSYFSPLGLRTAGAGDQDTHQRVRHHN